MNVYTVVFGEPSDNSYATVGVYSDYNKAVKLAEELLSQCEMGESVYIEEWMMDSEFSVTVWSRE
jgi:hypothetical protein